MVLEADRGRAEVRPGIFPAVPRTDIRVLQGWFEGDAENNPVGGLLMRSLSGLSGTEALDEASAIMYEVDGLSIAAQHGDRSAQGQAASLAALGQYHATEATVAAFTENLKPGEAEGFIAVAHLVRASQYGIRISSSSRSPAPEGLDHLNAGVIYLARAISARIAARQP